MVKYEPLPGIIRVGYGYDPSSCGRIYCAESELGNCISANNIYDLAQWLRFFNVSRSQICNKGTDNPIPTKKLEEDSRKYLISRLLRPFFRVIQKYVPSKEGKRTELSHPFSIETWRSCFNCRLDEVPLILNALECGRGDIVFLKETSNGYEPLN